MEISSSSPIFILYLRQRLVSRFTKVARLGRGQFVVEGLLKEGMREDLKFVSQRRIWGDRG
jgi:hypothetical protein